MGVRAGDVYFSVCIIVRIITSHHQHMFQCVGTSRPPFLRSDTYSGPFWGKPWRNAEEKAYETCFVTIPGEQMLEWKVHPCSAGTTTCWAPIVIRLGCLLFCFVWLLFFDLTNMFSKQTKSSLGQGETLLKDRVLFLLHPIPFHPLPCWALPSPPLFPPWKVKMVAGWGGGRALQVAA